MDLNQCNKSQSASFPADIYSSFIFLHQLLLQYYNKYKESVSFVDAYPKSDVKKNC